MFHNQGFQLWTISSDVAATSHGSNHIKLKYCKTTLTAMKKRPKFKILFKIYNHVPCHCQVLSIHIGKKEINMKR